jgi:hypothetical protein
MTGCFELKVGPSEQRPHQSVDERCLRWFAADAFGSRILLHD